MFKLILNGVIFKSYFIEDLWGYITKNKSSDYQFFIEYRPLTNSEFLKTYLLKTLNYNKYLELYSALRKPPSIYKVLYQVYEKPISIYKYAKKTAHNIPKPV